MPVRSEPTARADTPQPTHSAGDSETFGAFDFGLSSAQEQRAQVLHNESIIVDLLCQGPCGYRSFTESMEQEIREYLASTSDLIAAWNFVVELPVRHALRAGQDWILESCWRESGVTAGTREHDFVSVTDILAGLAIAAAQFDRFDWFVRATRPDHIRLAKQNGQIAGFVNSQDSVGFGTDLALLEHARHLGLAMLQLTYNSANFVGFGCMEPSDGGLTTFGTQFVDRANDLGIVIDTSHCGTRTTLDACAQSTRPVVASHTSAASLYKHARAKADEELKAIAGTGGVIGVYAVPAFLSPDPAASIEVMLDHIEYVAELVGWQHVAIGTDWPLQMPKSALRSVADRWSEEVGLWPKHRIDHVRNLRGFSDYRDFPNIARGLVARDHTDDEIRGILGENFLRVFGAVTA